MIRRVPTQRPASGTRGFVLVNALVLVAAFAAAAVWLLARAEQGRVRQAQTQGAAQTILYLDAIESLALALLARDQQGGAVDGPGDVWAQLGRGRDDPGVTLDRGLGRGRITDLQGRFNINWLANPEDILAEQGFVRLTRQLGLTDRVAGQITAFLRPGGGGNTRLYARARPPVLPRGGPVLVLEQLAMIPTLRPRELDILIPHIAALPSDSLLNVNTASAQVLSSMLPGTNAEGLAQVLQARRRMPFLSLDDFMARAAVALPDGTIADTDQARFGVGSQWFHVDTTVSLDTRHQTRQTIIHRKPLPDGPRVVWRLENHRR